MGIAPDCILEFCAGWIFPWGVLAGRALLEIVGTPWAAFGFDSRRDFAFFDGGAGKKWLGDLASRVGLISKACTRHEPERNREGICNQRVD